MFVVKRSSWSVGTTLFSPILCPYRLTLFQSMNTGETTKACDFFIAYSSRDQVEALILYGMWLDVTEHIYPVPVGLVVSEVQTVNPNLNLPHTCRDVPLQIDGTTLAGRRLPFLPQPVLLLDSLLAGSRHSFSAVISAASPVAWRLRFGARATYASPPDAPRSVVVDPEFGIVWVRQ